MRNSVWFIAACLFGSQAALAVTLPDCNAIKAWAAPGNRMPQTRRERLARNPPATPSPLQTTVASDLPAPTERLAPKVESFLGSEDVRAARQLKALVCRGIPPGAQRNQLCPADTDRRIAINSNGRPVWLAGDVEVALEATTGMTRVVVIALGR